MKRSRVFLGLTTACLAVAGIIAAKAANFGHAVAYYFTASTTGTCLHVNDSGRVPAGTGTQLTIQYGSKARNAYTASDCTSLFKFDPSISAE